MCHDYYDYHNYQGKKITISNFCKACLMKAGLTVRVKADEIYI